MVETVYRSRTFKMRIFGPLFFSLMLGPPLLLPLFKEDLTPTRFYTGAGAVAVALLLVVAGAQSKATFTAGPEGLVVATMNYLFRFRRTRHFAWSDVHRVEQAGSRPSINHAGSRIGGYYLLVHLQDGSTIRVLCRSDDHNGAGLEHFRQAVEQGIASVRGRAS